MLNLLKAPRGVYLVSLLVIVEDSIRNKHCVMLSTMKEKHAPFGKLIDNSGKMVPTYLEKKDTRGKEKAKKAWKLFIGQNPAVHNRSFTVDPIDVYELVKLILFFCNLSPRVLAICVLAICVSHFAFRILLFLKFVCSQFET